MGTGRFLALWGAAQRRQARRQLLAMQAAAYPWMGERERGRMFQELRDAASTQEQKEKRWQDGFEKLDSMLSMKIGGRRTKVE